MQKLCGWLALGLCLGWWGCKKKPSNSSPPPRSSKGPKATKTPKRTKTTKAAKVTDKEWKLRGKKVAQAAFGTLAGALMKGIKAGGVAKAIPICKAQAIPLTDAVASSHQVSLKRISHKPRNPTNLASKAELALIQKYIQDAKASKKLSPILKKTDKQVVFYAPIKLPMPLCLRCHGMPGKSLKAADHALIKKHYPKDRATGFKVGDIRGMWKVVFTRKSAL